MSSPSNAVKLADAARQLGKHPATIRRWIAKRKNGAPCVRPGEVGRGKGALVDLDAVRRWKAGDLGRLDDAELLHRLAVALWDTLKRDLAHERVGVMEAQAAGVLVLAFQRYWQNITRRPLDDLTVIPEEIKRLCAIYVP